jgi:hypothetical protein
MSAWIEWKVLPVLTELCGPANVPMTSSVLSEEIGKSRRQTYNYLALLERSGRVTRPSPRRWCVAP